MVLKNGDELRLVTASAVTTDCVVYWSDNTTSAFTPDRTVTLITTAATTAICAGPAASTQRGIVSIKIRNRHASSSNAIILKHFDGTNTGEEIGFTLLAGETLQYGSAGIFQLLDSSGQFKQVQAIGSADAGALTGATLAANVLASSLTSLGTVNNAAFSGTFSAPAGTVTLAMQANLAANSIQGNNTGGAAVPLALTVAQTKTLLAIAQSDVTSLVSDLALKSPLAGPTFTGVPAAPTAAADTNTTQLATTAFVLAQSASQAEQETATSTTKLVSPGRQHFHPSAVKCWGRFTVAGGITSSYNITSVADTGTGVITVTIATDFSGAGVYAAHVSIEATATTWAVANAREPHIRSATLAAGTVALDCIDNTVTTNLVKDPSSWHFAAYGDL